jgi:hypothetical protein
MSYFLYKNGKSTEVSANESSNTNVSETEISNSSDTNVSETEISTNSNANEAETDENNIKTTLALGTYMIQPDESIYKSEFEYNECNIKFSENNEFEAYIGEGVNISGTYSVSDSTVNCTITTEEGEYGGEQDVTGKIVFEIVDDTTIQITDVSETIKIKILGEDLTLSDEYKDYYLAPFVKEMKFVNSTNN